MFSLDVNCTFCFLYFDYRFFSALLCLCVCVRMRARVWYKSGSEKSGACD